MVVRGKPSLASLKEKKGVFEAFLEGFSKDVEAPERLREAVRYSLRTGGKRVRPIIALLFGSTSRAALEASLAVELFHTASLIADDLPCMDNDQLRRGVPSLHVAFGEATALLSSYGLICSAFSQIAKAADVFEGEGRLERLACAIEAASELAGLNGATGGQYLDLYPEKHTRDALEGMFYKKTGTLFELSFVLGWLFNNGDRALLPELKQAAYHFGLAFQIADDISDAEEDSASNIVHEIGEENARVRFAYHLNAFVNGMEFFGGAVGGFAELVEFMKEKASVF